jgi:hypothetical protein
MQKDLQEIVRERETWAGVSWLRIGTSDGLL